MRRGGSRDPYRAAVLTGARLDELAKSVRRHFDSDRKQLSVVGKRNKMRVIALEDGDQDFGFRLLSNLPASIETKALFWHRPPPGKQGGRLQAGRPTLQPGLEQLPPDRRGDGEEGTSTGTGISTLQIS